MLFHPIEQTPLTRNSSNIAVAAINMRSHIPKDINRETVGLEAAGHIQIVQHHEAFLSCPLGQYKYNIVRIIMQ